MALLKISRLESICFTDDGTLGVRFKKITKDDSEVLKEEWHRTSIPPGTDVATQMSAVNSHLNAMGFQSVVTDQIKIVSDIAALVHTDEVKAEYQSKISVEESLV